MAWNASGTRPLAPADEALLLQLGHMGRLSLPQANYARRVAHALGQPAAHVLRLLRLASDADMARALGTLHTLSTWWPDATHVEPAALAQVPFAFARQHGLLPMALREGVLQIATADPDDADARQRLRRHVPGEVQWVVAPRAPLAAAIEMA